MDPTKLPKVEELLDPQHLNIYHRQSRDIWGRLIRVHSNLEVMDRVQAFGLNEILPTDALMFWQSLLENYGDTVIMTLATLVVDERRDTLNLPGFARRVRQWLKPEHRDSYSDALRDARFDAKARAARGTIDHIRDHHVAHVLWGPDEAEPKSNRRFVSRTDVAALFEQVRQLFQVASLTQQHMIELNGYGKHLDGTKQQAYIDELLVHAARAAPVVRRPEQHADRWPERRRRMKQTDLERLIRWRARLGMSPP